MKLKQFALAITVLVVMLATYVGVNSTRAAAICSPATAISVPYAVDTAGDFAGRLLRCVVTSTRGI